MGGTGWGAPSRAARHRAVHGATLQQGQDGGKQTGRKRTFPGVRFSWKGACLELTSHGTKQQRLENRLKNLFYSRPALHVMKLQDGCILFCNSCFYVVLLAQRPVLSSEEALTPILGYIPTHPLVQGDSANWIHHPTPALFSLRTKTGTQGESEANRTQYTKRRTWLPSPSHLGCRSTLPAQVHLRTARHEPN